MSANEGENLSQSKARLKIRRGMLELDFFLSRFVDNKFNTLTDHQKKLFFDMLEWEDPVLYDCLIEKIPTKNPDFMPIVNLILLPG